jgi:hypothetical protein
MEKNNSRSYLVLEKHELYDESTLKTLLIKTRFFAALYKPPCRFPGSEARLIRKP